MRVCIPPHRTPIGPGRLMLGGATLLAGAIASYRLVVVPFARGDGQNDPPDPDAVLMLRSTTAAAGGLGLAALLAGVIWRWARCPRTIIARPGSGR